MKKINRDNITEDKVRDYLEEVSEKIYLAENFDEYNNLTDRMISCIIDLLEIKTEK